MQVNESTSGSRQRTSNLKLADTFSEQKSVQGEKLNKKLIIGLAFFVLTVLGVAGVLAYQNYQLKRQIDKLILGLKAVPTKPQLSTPTNTILVSPPISTIAPTVSFRTYRNEDFNFQFNYPSEWDFKLSTEQAFLFRVLLKKEDYSQRPIEMPGGTKVAPYYQILISIQDNPKNLSAKDFYLDVFSPESRDDIEKKLEEINVAGEKAIRYQEVIAPSSGLATTVSISHNGRIYNLSYGAMAYEATHEKYLPIFNKVLSSFKFTD